MAELKTIEDLLVHEIQGMYSAENLLLAGIPRMIQNAQSTELKNAFTQHLNETKQQVERLKQAADILGVTPDADGCAAMKGLITDGEKMMHKDAAPEVLDAALLSGAQKIEHHEIAAYGTAVYLAEHLGFGNVAQLLQASLDEEKKTNDLLNQIAKTTVNPRAAQA